MENINRELKLIKEVIDLRKKTLKLDKTLRYNNFLRIVDIEKELIKLRDKNNERTY